MASVNKLSVRGIEAWCKSGTGARLSDGGGLYLIRGKKGFSWALFYVSPATGKRREAGLGSLDSVGLSAARELAGAMRESVATGVDPLDAKKAEAANRVTFKQVSDEARTIARKRWRHVDRETERWDLAIDACKGIHNTLAAQVSVSDIKSVLTPFDDRPTAKRFVLSVIRRTLDVAVAKELRQGHPATARVIGKVVSLDHTTTHNPAMRYRDVPSFVATLRALGTDVARCLELIIRTGVRKSEATQATWNEFDLTNQVWHIPAERTKKGRAHDVPLTDRCMVLILEQQLRHPGSMYVWPGAKSGAKPDADKRTPKPMSHGAFLHLLPQGATVHGFRSALRDYLGNETDVAFATAEEVLGHAVGDATVRAYRRQSGLAKRRAALTYWGDFIDGVVQNVKHTPEPVATQPLRAVS